MAEQQLERFMKELGKAVDEALADSGRMTEVVAGFKEAGYDFEVVLEVTIQRPGSIRLALDATIRGQDSDTFRTG